MTKADDAQFDFRIKNKLKYIISFHHHYDDLVFSVFKNPYSDSVNFKISGNKVGCVENENNLSQDEINKRKEYLSKYLFS